MKNKFEATKGEFVLKKNTNSKLLKMTKYLIFEQLPQSLLIAVT